MTLSALRQAIAAAIAAELAGDGWREADDPWDQFGQGDGEGRGHLSYAVGVPASSAMADRQKRALGVQSDTTLSVRWSYALPALDRVAGYDAALDAGQALLAAIWTAADSSGHSLIYVASEQTVDEEGWMIGEITFRALHRLPLT